MFNDRKRLPRMADPRLQGQYTMRGLYQSLAVASMCINEEAAARPLIGDVVTALTYLANHSYESAGAAGGSRAATAGEQEERGGSRYARTPGRGEDEGGSGSRWEEPTAAAAAASAATATATAVAKRDFDRERAVAEAKLWGENWREKRRATAALGNSDV